MARVVCDPTCDVNWIDGRVECITWDVGNCVTPTFPDHCPVLSRFTSLNGCWFYVCPDPPGPGPTPAPTPAPTPTPDPGPDQWNEELPPWAIGIFILMVLIGLLLFFLCRCCNCCFICRGRRCCPPTGDELRDNEEGGLEEDQQGGGDHEADPGLRNASPATRNPTFDPNIRLDPLTYTCSC